MKKLVMGFAVLSGVVSGGVFAMSVSPVRTGNAEQVDETKVQQVIDARLHELLVKMNTQSSR